MVCYVIVSCCSLLLEELTQREDNGQLSLLRDIAWLFCRNKAVAWLTLSRHLLLFLCTLGTDNNWSTTGVSVSSSSCTEHMH